MVQSSYKQVMLFHACPHAELVAGGLKSKAHISPPFVIKSIQHAALIEGSTRRSRLVTDMTSGTGLRL